MLQEKPSEAPKPSRASVLVMPTPEAESDTKREAERDSSPELNVQQGCLQAPVIPPGPRDRPFQRGHAPQQPGDTAEKAQAEGRHQPGRAVSGAKARETNHHSDRRDRDQSEPQHAPLKMRNSPGRGRNPNDRRKDSNSRHHDRSHLKAGQGSGLKESDMGQSQRKADRSDGKADAAKLQVKERPATTADSKDKGVKSGATLESCCFAVKSAAIQAFNTNKHMPAAVFETAALMTCVPMQQQSSTFIFAVYKYLLCKRIDKTCTFIFAVYKYLLCKRIDKTWP